MPSVLGEGQAAVMLTPPIYTPFMEPRVWTWNLGESFTVIPVRVTLEDLVM